MVPQDNVLPKEMEDVSLFLHATMRVLNVSHLDGMYRSHVPLEIMDHSSMDNIQVVVVTSMSPHQTELLQFAIQNSAINRQEIQPQQPWYIQQFLPITQTCYQRDMHPLREDAILKKNVFQYKYKTTTNELIKTLTIILIQLND